MPSFITRLLLMSAVLGLTACASTPPSEHYLDAGARQHIKRVDAYLIAKQRQIGADISSNGMLSEVSALTSGVTLIPLFLDIGVRSVKSANANKMAKPMREALKGHDYPFAFKKQVRQSLEGTTLEGIEEFQIMRNDYQGMRGQLIAESDADAVLLVDMKYAFTANFDTLYVQSYAMLFPNRPELQRFQEVPDKDKRIEFSDNIYRNQYAVSVSTKLEDATAAEHAAIWAQMSEEQLVEVLDAAALILSDTIANDISIDDVESDLDLIPEGYVLNTKYQNLNQQFAKLRSLDSVLDTPVNDSEAAPETQAPETDVDGKRLDVKAGS